MKAKRTILTTLTLATAISLPLLAQNMQESMDAMQPQRITPLDSADKTTSKKLQYDKKTDLAIIKNTALLIDQAVNTDLKKSELSPFPLTDDATFLRRSYLKIIGRIPTHDETILFLTDKSTDKRAKLIDQLIYSPGFNSHLFNYWADTLRLITNNEQHGLGWHVWVRNAVDENMPYDTFVNRMLSAKGHVSKNPAVAYYLRDRGMLLDNVSNTIQVFLGTQIGCAQCHDHPFEDWTQKEYYSLAAFAGNMDYTSQTARLKVRQTVQYAAKKDGVTMNPNKDQANNGKKKKKKKKKNNKNRQKGIFRKYARDLNTIFRYFKRNEIAVNNTKTLKLPHDYQYNDGKPGEIVHPGVIFGTMPEFQPGDDKLAVFADWLTDSKNPQFTKTIANRLWKRVYGYALAEPVDNWTDRTKVSHPEALAIVEKILIANRYNIRETLRILYHTHLFQRQVSTAEITQGATYDFQGPILQRLSAEQIHDSLLTLERGNIDAQTNPQFQNTWNQYTLAINDLLTADPKTILEIDDLADRAEKQTNSYRKQRRALSLAVKKAQSDGMPAKAKELQAQLRKLSKKINSIDRKSMSSAMNNKNDEVTNLVKKSRYLGRNLRIRSRTPLRASELAAPAKGGKLLRQFGASDRSTPNAASTHASIPQTLTLLNGREVSTVTDPFGKKDSLPRQLSESKTPIAKLDTLFLAIYATYPTDKERQKYIKYMSNPIDIQILAKAMLNSKRFLFLQ